MMIRQTKLLGCCFLLLSSVLLEGCSPKPGGRVEVVFWAMGAEGEHVQKLVPRFEELNPGIHIKVQQIPWTAAHEKLLTAFAGNSLPDVCQLGNTWIPEFSTLGALEPLTQWMNGSLVVKKENYFPGIWETNVMDSSLYGIPWYVDTRLLFYRKDILAQAGYSHPPRTWDEWLDVSEKIVQHSQKNEHYAIFLPTNEWAPFVIAGLQAGSALLKDENRFGDFSGQQFHESFRYLMSFYRKKVAPVGITRVTNIYQGMAEGFFAMYITGPWNLGEFRRRFPVELQNEWMTAPMPAPGPPGPGVSLAGGSSLVMFKNSETKAAAWKFIEYMSRPESQLGFYEITGDLPAVRQAWSDSALSTNKYVKAFYEQLEHVVPTPKIPEWEQLAMKVQQYAEVASTGTVSVEDALASLDRDVNVILEKRRWMMDRK
ncbi:MAG: sugar ABC transporter substrate-binding protein [Bacteroidota bacterium]